LIYSTLLGEKGVLVSNEVMPQRLSILRENLDKWGIPNVFTLGMYPNKIPFTHCFDVVAVDAPCSGEGLFRKQIDYRGEWKESFAHTCAVRQHEILEEAVRLLKPGGYLLYSTCTFAPEENEEIISYLTDEFQLENIPVEMQKEWSVDVEALYIPTNVGQENLFEALVDGTLLKIKLLPKTGTGNLGYEGYVFVSSWEINPTPDDAVSVSVSFRGTGVLETYTA
jgi:16S rRNA C967 or C1407 C5-methylase (RsmB/RsmF family)